MKDPLDEVRDLRERQKLVNTIVGYPNWQFIIQFERRRDTVKVDRYLFKDEVTIPTTHRRLSGEPWDVAATTPARLPVRRSHRLSSRNIDAIETGKRLAKKFLPKLTRLQRGGVDFCYCVEDYSGLNAHASAFIGNIHEKRFTYRKIVQLAEESGLTIGTDIDGRYLITRWDEQYWEDDGLARYLLKSIDPTRFLNRESVLNSSSGVYGYSNALMRHLEERGTNVLLPTAGEAAQAA